MEKQLQILRFAQDDSERWEMFFGMTPAGGEDAASTAGQEALLPALAGLGTRDIMRSLGLILRNGNRNPSLLYSGARAGEIRALSKLRLVQWIFRSDCSETLLMNKKVE